MNEKQKTYVEILLDKAAKANNAADAMNFAQAACNAANALRAMGEIERSQRSSIAGSME